MKTPGSLLTLALGLARASATAPNQALVDALNADPHDGAAYSVDGPFGSMAPADFRRRLMPARPLPTHVAAGRVAAPEVGDTPDAVDWVAEGAVTSVKDQGNLGTCWIFSAVGLVEGQYALAGASPTNFSVEQVLECDASNDASNQVADCGVFGGWPYLALGYLEEAGGSYTWEDWPYCAYSAPRSGDVQCWPCMADGYSVSGCGWHGDLYCNASTTQGQGGAGLCHDASGARAAVKSWDLLSTDETAIAAALASTGPLSVSLNAVSLQFYKSGIFSPTYCDPNELDHAVLLVGYGEEDGTPYWTVKNSWGSSWGEDGYFRILRGSGTCGINTAVVSAVVEVL